MPPNTTDLTDSKDLTARRDQLDLPPKSRLPRFIRRVGWGLAPWLTIVVLLLLWEIAVNLLAIKTYLLPAPSVIWDTLLRKWDFIIKHTWVTTGELLGGFGLSVLVGIPAAILIVSSKIFERSVMPLLIFSQTVPKVAIAPLFVVWFGFGILPKILVAFLICFFPIVIDTAVGLRSLNPAALHLARSMGAGPFKIFWRFRLPNALPYIFSGCKVAVTLAVVGAVVGEFVGSTEGLGYILIQANSTLDTPLLFAVLTVLTVIGIVCFYMVEIVEWLVIPWHITKRGHSTE